ncbi:MAG: RagB/SusD family nutrient uptake outer membrane protein, partial [Tannerella sp.]|nr:RagB/SusD family nutrient uptake outer membrane protein [Tannerella sp.]
YKAVRFDSRDSESVLLGDDWIASNPEIDQHRGWLAGISIMRGQQAVSDPLLDYWTGNDVRVSLWIPIRDCDLFIEHVDMIPDMTAEDKADWKAQARFLKAYYLFRLLENYGPIILPETAAPDAPNDALFLPRRKVEDCFDYILALMDEAIPGLKERAGSNDMGQVDRVSAKSFKARVLLFRASPFFNGNSEYYANFLDHDGQPFFSQTPDPEKWKAALDAVNDAIASCEEVGLGLYRYRGQPYEYDREDWEANPERMQTLYDLRMLVPDPWNEEVIWGWIDIAVPSGTSGSTVTVGSLMLKPASYGGPGPANQGDGWLVSSYQAMERFYTEHGLPLDEDLTVNQSTLHEVVTTPSEIDPEYASVRGLLQPGVPTAQMYLKREPRLYAHLGITGGYYRAHEVRINTMMFSGTDGGLNTSISNWSNVSGIAVQKIVHPENYWRDISTQIRYPFSIVRMADLYLMKAEAMNEYYGPSQEVYDALNLVRTRAGIPKVEESYTNPNWVRGEALNKHLTKEGLREIIHRERTNEMAFECGYNFYDKIRWKKAVSEYSRPIWGWNYQGTTPLTFFSLQNIQGRKWSISDCLMPIRTDEMNRNANLIQNPGW